LKITLGTLKDKANELVSFLEPRVGSKPELSGGEIEIDEESARKGLKPRQVKTYVKRFLYMNGVRKNYRVFVEGKELTIQEIELGEEEEEKKEKVAEKIEKAEEEEKGEREEEGPKGEEEKEEKKEEPKGEKEKPKEAKAEKRKAASKKKKGD
jgi:hypothetical protein